MNTAAAFDGLSTQSRAFNVNAEGVLSITGTDANDKIRFNKLAGNMLQIVATLNGETTVENRSMAGIKSISVDARGGNDVIANMTSIRSILKGGAGRDRIVGGNGVDKIVGGAGADDLRGKSGNDLILGDAGNDLIVGGTGNDDLRGGTGNDVLFGEDGNDRMFGQENDDTLRGNAGNDQMHGGIGNDRLVGASGNDLGRGGAGNDRIIGNTGNDLLLGESGEDIVSGGAGNDRIRGGDDNDQLFGQDGNDVIEGEQGNDLISGAAGNDRLVGGLGDDRILGENGNDVIEGNEGADALLGGFGNDRFVFRGSNLGTDTIRGQAVGEKTLDFRGFATGVKVDLAVTEVQAINSADLSLQLGRENLATQVLGTDQSDLIRGNSRNNILRGGAGTNKMEGRAGNDTYVGGTGNDTFQFVGSDLGLDQIAGSTDGIQTLDFAEFAGEVTLDLADTTLQKVSELGSLGLRIRDAEAIDNVRGSKYGNTLHGNALNNRLKGGRLADSFAGRGGNDVLIGQGGDDTFEFGAGLLGHDHIAGGDGGVRTIDLSERSGGNILRLDSKAKQNVGDGFELTLGTLSYIANVKGSAFNDEIHGNSLDNIIDGGNGNDFIQAQEGNDLIRGGKGADHLFGQAGNDRIYGGDGRDILNAGSGNDGLFGGGELDKLRGGPGSDRFLLRNDDKKMDFSASDDAKILFIANPQGWRDSEVERVDEGLAMIHKVSNGNGLFKPTPFSSELHLLRKNSGGNNQSAKNLGTSGKIEFYNSAFNSSHFTAQTVLQNIAHNFDSYVENIHFAGFESLSGWTPFPPGGSPNYVDGGQGYFYRRSQRDWASENAKVTPQLDFAMTFTAYMMKENGAAAKYVGAAQGGFSRYMYLNSGTPVKISRMATIVRNLS